jgi:hypothetical protein
MGENHLTEAACLVEQGAQYSCRVGLRPSADNLDPIFAGFKAGAFSLFFGDSPFYHFDLDGRWQRAVIEGTHFLKGLDGRVQVVRRLREGPNLVLRRHILTEAEAGDFDQRIRSAVSSLITRLEAGLVERIEPPTDRAISLPQTELREFLERIFVWDADAWMADRARYLAAYGSVPLPFLPPECGGAVVVQATLGHSGGATFGGHVSGVPDVRPLAEFEDHCAKVAALWGRRLRQSRSVFLAGSDLFDQPVQNVVGYFEVIARTFPMARGPWAKSNDRPTARDARLGHLEMHALLDDFCPPKPDGSGWGELASRGLGRISLGVESGDDAIRALYRKQYTDEHLAITVRDLKSAGIGISLLTFVGAGGVERAGSHVGETARLFESLALGLGDFVFLLDENEIRDTWPEIDGITPLDRLKWTAEQARFKEALAPLKKRGVKVLPYTFDKQAQ